MLGYIGVFGDQMRCFEVFGGERGVWGVKGCRRHKVLAIG